MNTKELIKYWRQRADEIEEVTNRHRWDMSAHAELVANKEMEMYRKHAEELEQVDEK